MFRHVVLFHVYDGVNDLVVEAAIAALRELSHAPGVITFETHLSTDERKGRIIVEDVTFTDRGGFEAFRSTYAHARVAGTLATMSDWWIGDYETP